MRIALIVAAIFAAIGVIVFWSAAFVVHQTEQALVLQLGDPRKVIREPGLHFKTPFIQNAVIIDRRILDLDIPEEEVIAADQKRLVVDAFVRWRITDPLLFYITLQSPRRAASRLTALASSNMRSALGKAPFVEVVRDNRAGLTRQIRDVINGQAQDFGVEVVDFRIRRAVLPEANSRAIYRRMQTEREQEAAEIRARGQEAGREIRAQADKEVTIAIASAERDGQTIRGRGDACRNRIFSYVHGRDPDFFAFYRAMQAYERSFTKETTTFALSPSSSFFRYFTDPAAKAPEFPRAGPASRSAVPADLRQTLCPSSPVPDVRQ